MIRFEGRGLAYGELWYDEEPPADPRVDILIHRQQSRPVDRARNVAFLSLATDLSLPEDGLRALLGETSRYQIRRAETKDELQLDFTTGPEDRLDEFRAFFDAFAREISLWPSDPRWLRAACGAGQLALSSASRNGETLVWHAYVMSGKTAGLLHSSSRFRKGDSDYRALAGRANRWLHWKDMLQFQALGLQRYDWGGLFGDESTPERAGINNFKKNFGGQPVRSFDCTLPLSLRGRVLLPIRDAWRQRGSIRDLRAAIFQRAAEIPQQRL
jgi:hypothetical protein